MKLIVGNLTETESFEWSPNSRLFESYVINQFLLFASLYASHKKSMFIKSKQKMQK